MKNNDNWTFLIFLSLFVLVFSLELETIKDYYFRESAHIDCSNFLLMSANSKYFRGMFVESHSKLNLSKYQLFLTLKTLQYISKTLYTIYVYVCIYIYIYIYCGQIYIYIYIYIFDHKNFKFQMCM